jgi:hypothetical protein
MMVGPLRRGSWGGGIRRGLSWPIGTMGALPENSYFRFYNIDFQEALTCSTLCFSIVFVDLELILQSARLTP